MSTVILADMRSVNDLKAARLIDLCEECGICAEVCPIGAIHFGGPLSSAVRRPDLTRTSSRQRPPQSPSDIPPMI